MPFGEPSSAFWFYGRMHPAQRVPPFGVEEVPIEEGVRLEIVCDGIGVWSKPGAVAFKQSREALGLFRLVVAAYALVARSALDVTLDGWVEATQAQLAGSVIGFRVNRQEEAAAVDQGSAESRAMRTAADLAVAVMGSASARLSVRDMHAAYRDTTDDAYFFAFRAVEGALRTALGVSGNVDRDHWRAFHERLGLTADEGRTRLHPLTEARKSAGHGDHGALSLARARDEHQALLEQARWFVLQAMRTTLGASLVPDP